MTPRLSPLGRWAKPEPEPEPQAFVWDRTNALGLALMNCTACHGSGLRLGRKKVAPCNCTLRAIFRICLNKYRGILVDQHTIRTGSVFARMDLRPATCGIATSRNASGQRQKRGNVWSRPQEEFLADFEIIAKRTLDPEEMWLLKAHHIDGADFNVCCKMLRLNRGEFFHMTYRVEQKLGRAFAETRPYSLFPLGEYFHSVVRGAAAKRSQESGVRSQGKDAAAPIPEPATDCLALGAAA